MTARMPRRRREMTVKRRPMMRPTCLLQMVSIQNIGWANTNTVTMCHLAAP